MLKQKTEDNSIRVLCEPYLTMELIKKKVSFFVIKKIDNA